MHAFNQRILAEDLVRLRRPEERERWGHLIASQRLAKGGIHFTNQSLINLVPSPGMTSNKLMKFKVCFQ